MDIMNVLLGILIISIVSGVATGSYAVLQYIKIKVNNNIIDGAIEIIQDAVDEVSQTYVDELKERHQFDKESQQEALYRAIEIAQSNLTSKMKDYIVSNFDGLIDWISSQIEIYIWRSKSKTSSDNSTTKLNG